MANEGLYHDDNGRSITTPAGLRPTNTAAAIVVASTGGATAEVDIAALHTASASQGHLMVRVALVGTNAALVQFGAAAAAASYTSNDNMILMPANTVEYFRLRSTDVSFYHLQVTGSVTVQVSAMG